MTQIIAQPDETEVVVIKQGKSIIDQVLDLPNESIVLIQPRAFVAGEYMSTAAASTRGAATILHRTGMSGWRISRDRRVGDMQFGGGKYLTNEDIGTILADAEGRRATVHLLHKGGDLA